MSEQFGHYVLEGMLGRGGMGEVYKAYDTRRDRTVALKRLPKDLVHDETFQARFRRECQLVARLNEPHVIPIHDFGEIEGHLYLDMRLVEGVDLASFISDEGPLNPKLAVDIIGQVAAALQAAHDSGLVHRDVKPSNVLLTGLTDDKQSAFAYLVDFGIARSEAGGGTALTATTGTVGTLGYMAPERISGGDGDHRSDVYSLACVLFECLTGHSPFKGETFQVMFAHVNVPPPVPSTERAGLPPALDEVVRRGLAKDPAKRYQTTAELASGARAALASAGVAPPRPPMPLGPPGNFRPGMPPPGRGPQGPPNQPPGRHAQRPPQGPPNQGPPNQGPPNQGRGGPPGQLRPPQGPPGQGRPPQGVPNQGVPNQGVPNQGVPNQGPPNQGRPQTPPPGRPQQPAAQAQGAAVRPLTPPPSGPISGPVPPRQGPVAPSSISGPIPPAAGAAAPPRQPTSGPVPSGPPPRQPTSGPVPSGPPPRQPTSGPVPSGPGGRPPGPPTGPTGTSSGRSGPLRDKRNLIALGIALIVVVAAVIVVIGVTGGGGSPSAQGSSTPTSGQSGSTSFPSTSSSAPSTNPASVIPGGNFSNYTDFSKLIGSKPNDTSSTFKNATCVLAGPTSTVPGMIDQVICNKLSGSAVEYYVARFSSATDVQNYVNSLVSKNNFESRYWRESDERRGKIYTSPSSASYGDVTTSFCGMTTYLVDFFAKSGSGVTETSVYNDYWKGAPFPDTIPAACSS